MDAYDTLRQVLETQAVSAATDAGIQILLPNEKGTPPKGPIWGEFWFRTGLVTPTLGGGRKHFKKATGLMQFTLFAPEMTGDGPITRIADALEKAFSSKQFLVPPDGYVTLDDIQVEPAPRPVNGFFPMLVHTTFDFFYRDPDAVG